MQDGCVPTDAQSTVPAKIRANILSHRFRVQGVGGRVVGKPDPGADREIILTRNENLSSGLIMNISTQISIPYCYFKPKHSCASKSFQ
jgi:hypothetical protein